MEKLERQINGYIKNIKKEFPIFKQTINGKPLVYLDSANSSQKPKVVIAKSLIFMKQSFLMSVEVSILSRSKRQTDLKEDFKSKKYLICQI